MNRFDTLLIANRGEIACRIIESARKIGLRTVAVYSEADRGARHVRLADEAVLLGPAPAKESYLKVDALLAAAAATGAGAIHPGYGFLSEDAGFAEAVEAAGLVFVGPTPDQLRIFGTKHTARDAAQAAGVPMIAGSGLLPDVDAAVLAARGDRLPAHAQGHRRRRRHRDDRVPHRGRAHRELPPGGATRRRELQHRRRVRRALRRACPARGSADLR